jgi:hypothetical protein
MASSTYLGGRRVGDLSVGFLGIPGAQSKRGGKGKV